MYADDITIYTSGPVVAGVINGLNIYLSQVFKYINNNKLTVQWPNLQWHFSRQMLTSTTYIHKWCWTIKYYRSKSARSDARHPSHFYTTLQQYRSKSAATQLCVESTGRLYFGCYKETLPTTYQAIGRSILSYCCPACTPSPKDTNWSRLQRAQNSTLRIATGCPKMADVTELPQDAREQPVRQHKELISQQFSMACHLPQQLCHCPPDDRSERRRHLIGRIKPNIQQYLAEEPLSNTSCMSAISSILQDAVWTAIESSWWKLLNGRPPPIATAEQTLPRKARTILEQLRSGNSRIHGQYIKGIDPTAHSHCHDCGHSPHDTNHLFDWPSKPTTLTVESLLTAPTETAKHLSLAIDETS